MSNIYPIHDRLLQREAKEQLLGQRAKVLWFTGLSGAGKSTIAQHLEAKLYAEGFLVQVHSSSLFQTEVLLEYDLKPKYFGSHNYAKLKICKGMYRLKEATI